MKIDSELTEKSAKNTQRWWKLTATIVEILTQSDKDFQRVKRQLQIQLTIFMNLLDSRLADDSLLRTLALLGLAS